MIFLNKIIFVSSLQSVQKLLYNYNNFKLENCIYNDRIAISHHEIEGNNIVRMWKTKSLFNIWYDDFTNSHSEFVAAIDYRINDDHVKIEYLNINDDESNSNKETRLDINESNELTKSLLDFMKNKAKEENKKKVIIDVHQNLRLYEKYYKKHGFIATNRVCKDNRYWIETEFIVDDDYAKNDCFEPSDISH